MTSQIDTPRKRPRVSARRQLEPGLASHYMEHLPDLLKRDPSLPIVLLCRVSTDDQVRNGNLDEGMMDAWRSIRAWGVRPVVYDGVETSNIFGNRVILERAIEEARRLGAILVAPSRDRIIRSQCFGPGKTAKVEQPSVHEYEYLLQLANGVVLATLLPPDERGHSSQVRRGQAAKGRKGGRPRKKNPGEVKDRRLRLTPLAIKKLSSGMSQRATSAALGIAESTLRGWIKGWAVTDSEG